MKLPLPQAPVAAGLLCRMQNSTAPFAKPVYSSWLVMESRLRKVTPSSDAELDCAIRQAGVQLLVGHGVQAAKGHAERCLSRFKCHGVGLDAGGDLAGKDAGAQGGDAHERYQHEDDQGHQKGRALLVPL